LSKKLLSVASLFAILAAPLYAQQTTEPEPQQPPKGTVILHRSTEQQPDQPGQQPNQPEQPAQPSSSSSSSSSSNPTPYTSDTPLITPTDAERSALLFTSYDLDVHLTPATSHIATHAIFTVKNTGTAPLSRIALQISSTLHWETISLRTASGIQKLPLAQHIISTDADHTGQATEVVATLPTPLAPGETIDLAAIYSGEIPQSTQRLERIGANPDDAAHADWDAITPTFTGLRGFGNVLWYPTASAPISLSDNTHTSPLGLARLRQSTATIRLRITVEYTGDAPAAAYFCGRRDFLKALPVETDSPTATTPGVATAEFPARTLGFRSPNLFVVATNATATENMLISAVTLHPDVLPSYNSGSELVRPLLSDWLGSNPLEPLTILDHEGQPFEDAALLVAPMRPNDAAMLAPALTHSLSHAWFQSSLPWLNEGVAQFMTLLWLERDKGRDLALAELHDQVSTLALAEPQPSAASANERPTGQSLIEAHDEAFYGTKSAAVLWMLRAIVGDVELKHTLTLYRDTVAHNPKDETPQLFQHLLEETSHKDLTAFFNDWVYNDRGLADLSIVNVTPRDLSTGGKTTWLVAVEAHNEGDLAVDVPITVRSGKLTKTEYLHLSPRTTASTRIIFEGVPAEVQLNDGTIPEYTNPIHVRRITPPAPVTP
jgi:hypothetical protein